MLGRLHRTDVERLVMSYEIFRNAIQREIERRMKEMIIKEAQQHQHHNFQAPPPTKYVPKGAAIFKDIKSGAIVSIGEPVVPAMPSALSKSTSQPMQLNNLYNNFAHQHHLLHYQQQQQQQQHQQVVVFARRTLKREIITFIFYFVLFCFELAPDGGGKLFSTAH